MWCSVKERCVAFLPALQHILQHERLCSPGHECSGYSRLTKARIGAWPSLRMSGRDSNLEVFSHNPADGSFAPQTVTNSITGIQWNTMEPACCWKYSFMALYSLIFSSLCCPVLFNAFYWCSPKSVTETNSITRAEWTWLVVHLIPFICSIICPFIHRTLVSFVECFGGGNLLKQILWPECIEAGW